MFGFGEQYVNAYAIRLGATDSEIGILAAVPSFVGALFQLWGARLVDSYKDRRRIVATFVLLQALMWIPLFIVPFLTNNILYLTIIFSIYFVFANMLGPAWNSLMGDVVPGDERGRYFGRRNKITIAALFVAVLVAGLILDHYSDVNIWMGFAILFSIAFLGRLVSFYYILKHHEPQYMPEPQGSYKFREFLRSLPDTNFGKFVIFRSLIAFAVTIATPFFSVMLLKYANLSYLQYTLLLLAPMVVKFLTFGYWGRYADRFGNKKIMFITAFFVCFVPFWWFVATLLPDSSSMFYFLLCSESLSGFAWAGFDLTTFNYMLETERPERRARAFAYYNLVAGSLVMIGGLAGAYLVKSFDVMHVLGITISAIAMVFLISTVTRLMITLSFMKRMHEVRTDEKVSEGKLFVDMIIAKPMNAILQNTHSAMLYTERNLERIGIATSNTFEKALSPVKPLIKVAVERMDESLERVEPVRKRLEPRVIRKHKKRHYEQLVDEYHAEMFSGMDEKKKGKQD